MGLLYVSRCSSFGLRLFGDGERVNVLALVRLSFSSSGSHGFDSDLTGVDGVCSDFRRLRGCGDEPVDSVSLVVLIDVAHGSMRAMVVIVNVKVGGARSV